MAFEAAERLHALRPGAPEPAGTAAPRDHLPRTSRVRPLQSPAGPGRHRRRRADERRLRDPLPVRTQPLLAGPPGRRRPALRSAGHERPTRRATRRRRSTTRRDRKSCPATGRPPPTPSGGPTWPIPRATSPPRRCSARCASTGGAGSRTGRSSSTPCCSSSRATAPSLLAAASSSLFPTSSRDASTAPETGWPTRSARVAASPSKSATGEADCSRPAAVSTARSRTTSTCSRPTSTTPWPRRPGSVLPPSRSRFTPGGWRASWRVRRTRRCSTAPGCSTAGAATTPKPPGSFFRDGWSPTPAFVPS